MSQAPTVPPIVNQGMKFVLRSPVHGMVSKMIVLITFTGRKSGKTYTFPVGYSQHGDQVYVFTHRTWWKNLRGGAPVSLCLRGKEVKGIAEPVVEDKHAVAAGLAEHLRVSPGDARYYGVTLDRQGNPDADQVTQAAQSVVMIRIQLS